MLFHSPTVAWEKVLPVCLVNTASNLQATSECKIGYQCQLQHLNARSRDMHACIPCAPSHRLCAADTYKENILKFNCYRAYESDNCYHFKTFALLMYSRGVTPRIPSNPITLPCPCLYSLILISQLVICLPTSQSALRLLLGHAPCGVHKLWDMPRSLHSDCDQQKDNINHTQPLTSSVFISDHSLHQHVPARLRHSLQLCASSTRLINVLSYTFKVGSFFNAY